MKRCCRATTSPEKKKNKQPNKPKSRCFFKIHPIFSSIMQRGNRGLLGLLQPDTQLHGEHAISSYLNITAIRINTTHYRLNAYIVQFIHLGEGKQLMARCLAQGHKRHDTTITLQWLTPSDLESEDPPTRPRYTKTLNQVYCKTII